MANAEVQRSLRDKAISAKKRGTYHKYDPKTRTAIGKYACINGLSATSRLYSRKLGHHVSVTTIVSIKKGYIEEKKRRRDDEIVELPMRKRGRPLLLGEIDERLQQYLRKARESGCAINSRIVVSAARGLIMHFNPSLLVENGGHIALGRKWALSILERMRYVKRKGSTAKSKETLTDFTKRKEAFLKDIVDTVGMEDVPCELILNWDQTGIKLVPSSNWTMELSGSKRVEMLGMSDKRQITVVLCGTLLGDYLPPQVIYQGKTNRCHPRYEFPNDWNITHSPKHWSTEQTMLEYINIIVYPYVASVRHQLKCDSPALVVIDNFKGQITPAVTDLLDTYNIHTCLLPPNTTDKLQPLDISVNKPVKDFLRQRFDEWYSQEVFRQLEGMTSEEIELFDVQPINLSMARMKEISADWLVQTSVYLAENPLFLVNGWIKSGITNALDHVDSTANESAEEELSEDDFSSSGGESETDD